MSTSAFASALAAVATQQYRKYHLLKEQDPELTEQIKAYWSGIAKFPGVGTAWSAVFVSWCVRKAGATDAEFHFAQSHSEYFYEAIQNQVKGVGVFRGRKVTDYAPQVGDIVQNNRNGHHFDYAYAQQNRHYESHSAIVVDSGAAGDRKYLWTVGGNEGDSVGESKVWLLPSGLIDNASGSYIAIMQDLK